MFNPNLAFLLVQKLKSAPRALSSSLLSSAWTWIASLNIIGVFHLGLSGPYSYHYFHMIFVSRLSMFCASL
jgi:hypothetical protein